MHDAGRPVHLGEITIRLGRLEDAHRLAEIAAEGSPAAEARFSDRLSITHGDDYFCLVADAPSPLGYLLAGATRDADRKGFAEIYEITVAASARRRGIGRALLEASLERVRAAGYGGLAMWVPAIQPAPRALALACGLDEDPPSGDPPAGARASAEPAGRASVVIAFSRRTAP